MGISATAGCAVANLKLLLLRTRLSAQEKAAGFSRNPPAVFSLSAHAELILGGSGIGFGPERST